MYNLAPMRKLLISLILMPLGVFAQLSELLVTERSLVIMDLSLEKSGEYLIRGDWEGQAQEVQSQLKLTGVDAVAYLHNDDWEASTSSQDAYRLFFATRGVRNLIVISNEEGLFSISIFDFQTQMENWKANGGSLNQAIFRLGKEIKRMGLTIENFLPIDVAEVFTDIPFSKWSVSQTYPDRIKRMTIGIAQFEDPAKNEDLKRLVELYPFRYELFDYTDDEDAFRKGYQYVLLNMTTAGSSIQSLLNYQGGIAETDFISTIKGDSSSTALKTIPVGANVTKFYFRQTVNHEVFVGRNWDADVSWRSSLENFIHNLRIAFKRI